MAKEKKKTEIEERYTIRKSKPLPHRSEGKPEAVCRCEEVAHMTPAEMVKLALDDLAFWKKPKRPEAKNEDR